MLHITADLSHLEREVTGMLCHLVLLNFQQAADLCIIIGIGLAGIPCNDIAQLTVVKQFLLIVNLDILRHQGNVRQFDTTVLANLAQVTLQHVALLGIVLLGLLILTGTALIHLNLLVDELIINSDVIIVNFILTGQFCLEVRSYSNIKLKGQRCITLEIELFLLSTWQRLT